MTGSLCMTSRLNFPEAGTLCTTPTVKIWIYRPGGLRPVTFDKKSADPGSNGGSHLNDGDNDGYMRSTREEGQ